MIPATFRASRRQFLHDCTLGVGSVALAWLLDQDRLLADPSKPPLERQRFDLTPKPPHAPAPAKAMISLFMQGGPSHVDLLDPKPALAAYEGKSIPGSFKFDSVNQASTKPLPSLRTFCPHGQSGIEVSELLSHLAKVVDDVAVIRSMHTGVNNHVQSVHALNSGRILPGHPVLGSWLTYGLGSVSQNLPAFVALTDPLSLPVGGVDHWTNGWLPSVFQGTVVRPREPRILNLDPPPHLKGVPQERYLKYLDDLNRAHLAEHAGELDLEARISSYELAAQMQSAAKEALDLSQESAATKQLYGLDDPATQDYGTRCLLARRLVERGVRFVQVFTSNQLWDHHASIKTSLPAACRKTDRPAAALVQDLKSRGLLSSTLVSWGGEMGRLPVMQQAQGGPDKLGRDHNTYGFTWWLAGGGVKGGTIHGATDEFGHHAVTDVVNQHDLHATLLHLFGLDPKRLTYHRNGQELSLLDGQPSRVVQEIIQ